MVKICRIRKEIELDKYVIMPNHLHGIVIIQNNNDRNNAINNKGAINYEGASLAPLRNNVVDISRQRKSRSPY